MRIQLPYNQLFTDPYSFQGMEHDDEVKGDGNSYTTEFRQYDSRLGRWLTLDPLMSKYPDQSPYVGFNNNPIYFIDPSGLEGTNPSNPPTNSKGSVIGSDNDRVVLDEVTVKPKLTEKQALKLKEKRGVILNYKLEDQSQIAANPTKRTYKCSSVLDKERKDFKINVTYKGKVYRFSVGGTIDGSGTHQIPENFYWWYYNQHLFKNDDGTIAQFDEIFLSNDEEWNSVGNQIIIESFQKQGGDGDNPTGANANFDKFVSSKTKWKYYFPYGTKETEFSAGHLRQKKQMLKQIKNAEILKCIPKMNLTPEDQLEIKRAEENKKALGL